MLCIEIPTYRLCGIIHAAITMLTLNERYSLCSDPLFYKGTAQRR